MVATTVLALITLQLYYTYNDSLVILIADSSVATPLLKFSRYAYVNPMGFGKYYLAGSIESIPSWINNIFK